MGDSSHRHIFLSAVSAEFRSYRELLAGDLKRPNLDVKVQEDFITTGGTTLEKLDDYIRACDAVVHLVGDGVGATPERPAVEALLKRYPDLTGRLPFLDGLVAADPPEVSYTQWEAYLALYHEKPLHIYLPTSCAPRDAGFSANDREKELQKEHFDRLRVLGRDRGRFSNQERLSSAVLRDLHEILPRHEPAVVVAPSRLRHVAERLVGREEALQRLEEAWAGAETNVVVIRAWGGVGKTSLAAEWMGEMALKGWRGARRVFDWSFYSQGVRRDGDGRDKAASADVFVAEALKFFGDPDPQSGSPWGRGARLSRLVGQSRNLLVLDGLEPLQHPPGPLAGELKDPALAALLKGLAQQNAGLCLVTTREKVTDLASFYAKTAVDWDLKHLTEVAGAALLRTLGVKAPEKELQEASREVRGHALTLQLMGRYLKMAHDGDLRKKDTFRFVEADAKVQGGHAFRVLAAYEMWLDQEAGNQEPTTIQAPRGFRLRGLVNLLGRSARAQVLPHSPRTRQLAILWLLGLFDRPVDPGCLAALGAAPAIAGLTGELADLSAADWNVAVNKLEEIGLVARVPFDSPVVRGYDQETALRARLSRERGIRHQLPKPKEFPRSPSDSSRYSFSLDAHPLLREYFGRRVLKSQPRACREGHRRLYQHLQARAPYWPEGLEGLQPLYQAVAHGCQAGLHQRVCDDVYRDRILRGTGLGGNYSTFELGAIVADLGALASFFESPWSVPAPGLSPPARAWLLNEAAFSLRGLGRLSEAVEPMRAGLAMSVEQKAWENAASGVSNLRELQMTLGEVSAGVADGQQAVILADRSEDAFHRTVQRAGCADALHQAGRHDAALRLFQEAEALQAKGQLKYPRLYSLQGFLYCDLLLAGAERAGWRRCLDPEFANHDPQWKAACTDASERATEALGIVLAGSRNLLVLAANHLTLGQAALYQAVLTRSACRVPSSAGKHLTAAVDRLRQAGRLDWLPRGLLSRAWLRCLSGDEAGCRGDLEEAWEVAERGRMRLFMADIQLTRARLFRDLAALKEARQLIQQTGYHRRDEELADAEAALIGTAPG